MVNYILPNFCINLPTLACFFYYYSVLVKSFDIYTSIYTNDRGWIVLNWHMNNVCFLLLLFFLLYIYKYDIIEVIALIRLFLLCTWSQCERANSCRPQVKVAYGHQIWIFHQSNVTDNTIRTAGSREHIYYSRQNVKLSLLVWFESNKRTCKSLLIVYKPWHPYRQRRRCHEWWEILCQIANLI